MALFNWEPQFETGLADVDKQHKYLVNLINGFGKKFSENDLADKDFQRIFKELAEYSVYHFQDEEKLMSRMGVDQRHVDRHVDVHKRFLEDVTAMHAQIDIGNREATRQLLNFLTHWLVYHILGSDQNMGSQIHEIQKGVLPKTAYEHHELGAKDTSQTLLVALDALFQVVSQRNKALTLLNQSLEEKVAERTRELSEANIHLETIALTDALTGLPNRRQGMRVLKALWTESVKENTPLSCMMIDADHFKAVNDTHGHDAGDAVLCELAITLDHSVRTDDLVCRLGGDEFLIICPNTDRDGGLHLAGIIHQTVSMLSIPTGDGAWKGSISVGVADRSKEMVDYETLIKRADEAVYAAKKSGKNCVKSIDDIL